MNWRALAEQQPWHVAATWIAGAGEVALDIWKEYRVRCNLHPQIGFMHLRMLKQKLPYQTKVIQIFQPTKRHHQSHPNFIFSYSPTSPPPPPSNPEKSILPNRHLHPPFVKKLLRWVWCFGLHFTEILGGCLGASQPPGRCATLGAAALKSSLGCCHLAICFSLGTQGGVQSSGGDLWEIWHLEIQLWWNI